jgi:hypothetical protein
MGAPARMLLLSKLPQHVVVVRDYGSPLSRG